MHDPQMQTCIKIFLILAALSVFFTQAQADSTEFTTPTPTATGSLSGENRSDGKDNSTLVVCEQADGLKYIVGSAEQRQLCVSGGGHLAQTQDVRGLPVPPTINADSIHTPDVAPSLKNNRQRE